MKEKTDLSRAQRRSVTLRVVQAQKLMPRFERPLMELRTKEVTRVLNLLKGQRLEQMPDIAHEAFNEPYLRGIYERMYLNVGVNTAKLAINDFLSRKSEFDDVDNWALIMNQYIDQYAGAKIAIVKGTMKEFMRDQLRDALGSSMEMSVEQHTRYILENVAQEWQKVAPWMVRRIVQTETMIAMSHGQYASMMQLGIPFTKTWSATGRNTRPQHELMNGVTVPYDQLFIMPNGDKMMYPHDEMNGASADNIINCCCGTFDRPL